MLELNLNHVSKRGPLVSSTWNISTWMCFLPQFNITMDEDIIVLAQCLENNVRLQSSNKELETRNRKLEDEIESLRLWCQSCESRAEEDDKNRQENEQVGYIKTLSQSFICIWNSILPCFILFLYHFLMVSFDTFVLRLSLIPAK